MAFLTQFIRRPQRLWVRRFNFQVHLWVGILLSLYLIMIGITGSILVFRTELEKSLNPWHNLRVTEPFTDITAVVDNVRAAYPKARLISVSTPTSSNPTFLAIVQSSDRERREVRIGIHPVTAVVLGEFPPANSWISVIQRLHVNLLIGIRGRQANGVAAAFLILLNVTGMVIWWPGLRCWTRALKVDFRRHWRRVNFDLHRAAGFWTLSIASFWAISGIYFGFPSQTVKIIDRISPIITAKAPLVTVSPERNPAQPDLRAVVAQARALDPGTTLKGIAFPFNRRAPLLIFMNRRNAPGYDYADTLFFNPYQGRHLATWRYGVNRSFGDWLLWLQTPLHFGTDWGLGIKILWALLGLAIPLLTVTGAVMYWNRALRRKWKQLRLGAGRRYRPDGEAFSS